MSKAVVMLHTDYPHTQRSFTCCSLLFGMVATGLRALSAKASHPEVILPVLILLSHWMVQGKAATGHCQSFSRSE